MSEFRGTVLTGQELVRLRSKNDPIFPVRGPKQFIPSHSWLEEKQLQTLLDATKDLLSEERVERESVLARAEWDESLKIARVTRIIGHHFDKFGHEEGTTVFLYPEEALYLLEMNNLEILFGGVSMSVQQAYMVLLNSKVGCTFQEYTVFSHLLKNGFKVLRHCPKRTVTRYERLIGLHSVKVSKRSGGKNKRIVQDPSFESNSKVKEEKNVNDLKEKCVGNSVKDKKCENHKDMKDNGGSAPTLDNISCVEVTVDGNSSSLSDIEILSEKSVSNLKSDNDFDLNDDCSSFSVSEDSDCQVVFSKAAEKQEMSFEKHCIEEINLSDSDESVECERRNEDAIKIEPIKLEMPNNSTVQDSKNLIAVVDNLSSDCNYEDSHMENKCNQVECLKETITDTRSNVIVNSCSERVFPEPQESTHVCVEKNISLVNNDSVMSINEIVKSPVSQEELSNNCLVKEESVSENSFLPFEGKIYSSDTEDNLDERIKSSKDLDKIEVIDLDDEPRVLEDRWTILNSFPNAAGCSVVLCDVPPSYLCPPQVNPIQPKYSIFLERLEDPRFGGSHKRRKNNGETYEKRHKECRFHRNMPHRLANIPPNRSYNRRFNSRQRFGGHRHRGHHSYNHQDVRFPNNSYSPDSLMYPPIYNNCTPQLDHGSFPFFSVQSFQPSLDYNRHIPRWRDHQHTEGSSQYPVENESHSQRPQQHRYPWRRCRDSRTSLDHNRADGHNAGIPNNGERGFIPLNIGNTSEQMSYQQSSSAQVHKRRKDTSGELSNHLCSRGKYPRRAQERNFTSYQSLNAVGESMNSVNSEEQNTETSTEYHDSRTRCGVQTLSLNADSENYSSSDTHSSDESSCSEDSDDSTEESMGDEPGDENIHELLKPENLKDIDVALKSLHLVKSEKLQNLDVSDEPLLSIKFDLYLPSTHFRKSEPPLPDFRLVIMSPDQMLPTSRQLSFLEESFDDDVPLLFAVASPDSVSFFLHSRVNLPEISSKEKVQT